MSEKLSEHCQRMSWTLREHCQRMSGTLREHCQRMSGTLRDHCQRMSGTFHEACRKVPCAMFHRNIAGMFQEGSYVRTEGTFHGNPHGTFLQASGNGVCCMGSGYRGAEPAYGYGSRQERNIPSYGRYNYPSSNRSTVHIDDSDYEYTAPKGNSSNYIVDF